MCYSLDSNRTNERPNDRTSNSRATTRYYYRATTRSSIDDTDTRQRARQRMSEAAKQRTTKTKAEAIRLIAPSRLPTALNLACRCSSCFPAIVLHSLSLTQQQQRESSRALVTHCLRIIGLVTRWPLAMPKPLCVRASTVGSHLERSTMGPRANSTFISQASRCLEATLRALPTTSLSPLRLESVSLVSRCKPKHRHVLHRGASHKEGSLEHSVVRLSRVQCDGAKSFKHLSITDRLAATHKHRLTKKLVLRADLLALAYVSFQSRITLSLVPYLTWSDAQ